MDGLTPYQSCLLRLNAMTSSRPDVLLELLRRFGPQEIFSAAPGALAEALRRDPDAEPSLAAGEAMAAALARAARFDADGEAARAGKAGASLLFHGEPGYPELLQSIEDAPLVLYVRGHIKEDAVGLAFVGSRFPTAYGRRMAARLCADAAAAGYCVVSGLARGIDTEAHQAALRAEGLTWAVLGGGLGRIYPAENAKLAESIVAAGGALVTEFSMGAAPLSHHFPQRNRIISGLSWATVVVEGRMKSGSLITAKAALRQGRPVLAVPGPADSPLGEAPHYLLSEGAAPASRLADVVAQLPAGVRHDLAGPIIRNGEAFPDGPQAHLPSEERKILQLLGSDSLTLEELGRSTGLDFLRLSTIIFELEMQDLVALLPGQRYAKKGN